MFRNIFLIFLFIIKLEVSRAAEISKIINARIQRNDWKLLLHEQDHNGLDLFSKKKLPDGKSWDVVLRVQESTLRLFKKNNIPFNVTVENTDSIFQRRHVPDLSGLVNQKITFAEYVTYEEIQIYLKGLPSRSNSYRNISVESIGKTIENRDIMMVKIVHLNSNYAILFDGGFHAREWLSIMQALYLIEQVTTVSHDSKLTRTNWYVIPCMNPDGYVYSHTSEFNRLQRKNMNKEGCPSNCKTCGVDLNRNFGYHYGDAGTSTNPCSQIYRGKHAFSEPESRALRDVLQKYAGRIKLYLTFHTFGYVILYPWGYAKKKCDDWPDLRTAGLVARDSIYDYSKKRDKYEVLNTGEDFGAAAGGSDDYAKYLGIKYSYTMELQPGGVYGFDPSHNLIKQHVENNFIGIKAMVAYIDSPYYYKNHSGTNINNIFIILYIVPAILHMTFYRFLV